MRLVGRLSKRWEWADAAYDKVKRVQASNLKGYVIRIEKSKDGTNILKHCIMIRIRIISVLGKNWNVTQKNKDDLIIRSEFDKNIERTE